MGPFYFSTCKIWNTLSTIYCIKAMDAFITHRILFPDNEVASFVGHYNVFKPIYSTICITMYNIIYYYV